MEEKPKAPSEPMMMMPLPLPLISVTKCTVLTDGVRQMEYDITVQGKTLAESHKFMNKIRKDFRI